MDPLRILSLMLVYSSSATATSNPRVTNKIEMNLEGGFFAIIHRS
jgi:hypothetical protein